MSDKLTFVLVCSAMGPDIMFPDDELVTIACERNQGHTQEHRWHSDDGSVVVRWEDEWSLDDGQWRQEVPDE